MGWNNKTLMLLWPQSGLFASVTWIWPSLGTPRNSGGACKFTQTESARDPSGWVAGASLCTHQQEVIHYSLFEKFNWFCFLTRVRFGSENTWYNCVSIGCSWLENPVLKLKVRLLFTGLKVWWGFCIWRDEGLHKKKSCFSKLSFICWSMYYNST